jgi:hypothetical protein
MPSCHRRTATPVRRDVLVELLLFYSLRGMFSLSLSRVFARTEAGPEEDFGDHCVCSCWVFAPARVLVVGIDW